MSTTKNVSTHFAGNNGMVLYTESDIKYQIKGISVNWIGCFSNENEIILYNQKIKIKGNDIKNKRNLNRFQNYLMELIENNCLI